MYAKEGRGVLWGVGRGELGSSGIVLRWRGTCERGRGCELDGEEEEDEEEESWILVEWEGDCVYWGWW